MDKKKEKASRTGIQKPEFHFDIKEMIQSLRSETFRFGSGAFLAFAAVYIILAYLSFIFNGGIDQSAITSASSDIANNAGSLGARTAQLLVNEWFGIPSVMIPILILIIGLRLMARNLADRRYARSSGYPMPGRSFYAEFDFKF